MQLCLVIQHVQNLGHALCPRLRLFGRVKPVIDREQIVSVQCGEEVLCLWQLVQCRHKIFGNLHLCGAGIRIFPAPVLLGCFQAGLAHFTWIDDGKCRFVTRTHEETDLVYEPSFLHFFFLNCEKDRERNSLVKMLLDLR